MLDFAQRAEQYAQRVVAGEIVAGKWVKAACQRHLDDLERVAIQDAAWPYYFDHEEANRVCAFIEQLPHIKGDSATPQRTESGVEYPKIQLEDFQVFIIAVIFGWLQVANRLRRFRRAYIEVARKNTKSTLLAGIALYMLAGDGEQGPEVYTSATKKEQARIVWEVAQEMVRKQPEFKQLGVGYNKSVIYSALVGGTFKPLARDYGSLDGLNTSCFISDELHAQKDRKLYDVLDSSTGARSQPLGIGITTAGTDRAGVCYAQRTYVTKLLNTILHKHDGMGYQIKGGAALDETYFGIIYTIDTDYADKRPNDEWSDPKVWPKANPMLLAECNTAYAQTLLADLIAKCQKALTMPSEQSEFRTKHTDTWLNADTAWMDMHAWNACADPDLDEKELAGADCAVGLDAAFKTDIFAKMKVIEKAGIYHVFGKYWVPRRMADMKGNDHILAWAAAGWIEICDGAVVDVEPIKKSLRDDRKIHTVKEVPFDPAQLTQFAGEMIDEGFVMVEYRPTVLNFSEPMKKLYELALQGKLRHRGDPVLEWMVSNVVCHRDHKDGIYPNKEKPQNKIDGVIGTLMALGRMLQHAPRVIVIERAFVET